MPSTKIVLRLKNLEGVSHVLSEHGHLRDAGRIKKSRKTQMSDQNKGEHQAHADSILKHREDFKEQLVNFENLERDARNRGDAAETKRWQESCVSMRQSIENLRA